jgi:hypothetical protein
MFKVMPTTGLDTMYLGYYVCCMNAPSQEGGFSLPRADRDIAWQNSAAHPADYSAAVIAAEAYVVVH